MSYKYQLATTTWDAAEYQAIARVTGSGMFSMGQAVSECEKRFADWAGSRYSVMVNSGSSANLLMVAALFYTAENSLKAGDEVIVPAVSWSTTYYPLYQYGLRLKFVDVDLHTLNYDLEALEAAVTDRTRCIMAVNLLGNPNDFTRIQQIIGSRNIRLIEDNCESMGATFNGRRAGTFGVMGTFSSYFSHHISTMEGGFIVTDDEELYHIMLSIRSHGWTRHLPRENRVTGIKSDDAFEESFKFVLPGYNVRPIEMMGAIGIEQIKKIDHLVSERRRNGALIQERVHNHRDIMIQQEIGESSWFGFSLVIRQGSSLTRAQLLERLDAAGIESRPIVAGNFTKNPVMRYFDAEVPEQLPNADHIDSHGLFIGNQHYDISEVVDIIARI